MLAARCTSQEETLQRRIMPIKDWRTGDKDLLARTYRKRHQTQLRRKRLGMQAMPSRERRTSDSVSSMRANRCRRQTQLRKKKICIRTSPTREHGASIENDSYRAYRYWPHAQLRRKSKQGADHADEDWKSQRRESHSSSRAYSCRPRALLRRKRTQGGQADGISASITRKIGLTETEPALYAAWRRCKPGLGRRASVKRSFVPIEHLGQSESMARMLGYSEWQVYRMRDNSRIGLTDAGLMALSLQGASMRARARPILRAAGVDVLKRRSSS